MMKKLLIAASLLMIPVATPAFGNDAHGPAKDLTIPIIAVDNPGQYGGHAFHGSFKRLPPVRLDGGETYNVGVIKSKAVKGEIPMDPVNRTWHQEDPVRETSYNQYNQSWEQAPATDRPRQRRWQSRRAWRQASPAPRCRTAPTARPISARSSHPAHRRRVLQSRPAHCRLASASMRAAA